MGVCGNIVVLPNPIYRWWFTIVSTSYALVCKWNYDSIDFTFSFILFYEYARSQELASFQVH